MLHRTPKTVALLAGLVALPTTVYAADNVGTAGYVDDLEVYEASADAYLSYHGRVFISSKNSSAEYRWGGASCGTKVLSDTHLMVLTLALANGVKVQPYWRAGQGSAKCLVGLSLQS